MHVRVPELCSLTAFADGTVCEGPTRRQDLRAEACYGAAGRHGGCDCYVPRGALCNGGRGHLWRAAGLRSGVGGDGHRADSCLHHWQVLLPSSTHHPALRHMQDTLERLGCSSALVGIRPVATVSGWLPMEGLRPWLPAQYCH